MRRRAAPGGRMPSWWGSLTGRAGVCIVLAAAAVGALVTVLAGAMPGAMLGICLVAGTLAAALAIQPRAVYRIIPVPALAYTVAAAAVGLVDDRAASTSHTALAVHAAQWIASGFLAMTAATILAIIVTVARRLRNRPILGEPGYTPRDRPAGPVYFPADRPTGPGYARSGRPVGQGSVRSDRPAGPGNLPPNRPAGSSRRTQPARNSPPPRRTTREW